uniref:Uncharacterized protein n=1 Tax=Oryza punctata TaxID=4537 RepID=A0A0E0MG04_ORYPU
MKFLIPPPLVLPPPPDLSYITNRTDLSVDEKIQMIIKKHSGAPIPFEESQIIEYCNKFMAQYSDYEDEDSEEDSEEEAEEEKGKKVLGDEKEPGTVKRAPQAPLEGEPVCKTPRATPPQGEHNSKSPVV